jgi:hypothetical protein
MSKMEILLPAVVSAGANHGVSFVSFAAAVASWDSALSLSANLRFSTAFGAVHRWRRQSLATQPMPTPHTRHAVKSEEKEFRVADQCYEHNTPLYLGGKTRPPRDQTVERRLVMHTLKVSPTIKVSEMDTRRPGV